MATKIQWQPKFQLQLSSNGNISSNGNKSSNGKKSSNDNKSSNGNECNPRGLASYKIWACFWKTIFINFLIFSNLHF